MTPKLLWFRALLGNAAASASLCAIRGSASQQTQPPARVHAQAAQEGAHPNPWGMERAATLGSKRLSCWAAPAKRLDLQPLILCHLKQDAENSFAARALLAMRQNLPVYVRFEAQPDSRRSPQLESSRKLLLLLITIILIFLIILVILRPGWKAGALQGLGL